MHPRVHMTWTDSDGNIGLSWNMLKQLFGTCLHAVHVGDGMFAVHVVHYIEVAHFIIRGTAADKTEMTRDEYSIICICKLYELSVSVLGAGRAQPGSGPDLTRKWLWSS